MDQITVKQEIGHSPVWRLRYFAIVFGLIPQPTAHLRGRRLRLVYCCSDDVRCRGAVPDELVQSCFLPFQRKDHTKKTMGSDT